jgi:hypothetical protein
MTKRTLMTLAVLGGLFGASTFADTFIAGTENSAVYQPGTEGIGDYNDMIVQFGAAGLVANVAGQWNTPFNSSIVNDAGPSATNPFWDNPSLDGPQANIGYCLTGTSGGQCPLSTTPAAVTEFLTASGNEGSPANFTFSFTSGTVSTVFLAAITPQSGQESFGIYNLSNGQAQWIVQNGVNVVGSSFTPMWSTFGLIFTIPNSGGGYNYYYSGSTGGIVGNVPTTLFANRFALFDLPASSVPEPGTMALFGLGALVLGLIPRLRKRG